MERERAKRYKKAERDGPFRSARQAHTVEHGQALLEFAFVLPLLCLLMVGIVEIGRAARMSIVVTNSATAGTEFGAQGSSNANNTSGIQNAALCDANGGNWGSCNGGILTVDNIAVTHACRCDDGSGLSCERPLPADGTCNTISCGSEPVVECIQVTTHATFPPLLNWPGLPTSFQSNGNSIMRVQRQ